VKSVAGAGVVVTGGGSGIGAAMARRFAAEGARVVVNDLSADAAKAVAASCGAVPVGGDAAGEEGVAALIAAARHELGEIDLYCANAGVASTGGPETSEADWAASWQVNVMAHVRAARLLIGPWLERGSGHLICTVSAAGLLAMPGTLPYSVTKHAALSFAEWMAFSYLHRGITVQAICPLGVRTAMLDGNDPQAEKVLGAYAPVNRALRFCVKAMTPSAKSPEAAISCWIRASNSSWESIRAYSQLLSWRLAPA